MQTLSDFQNATGKKAVGRYFTERGSKLKKIDSALYEYHKDNSIKNLNVLLSVYLAWLKAKVDRRQSTTFPLSWDQPRGANEPLARRRSAVAELTQEALIELAKYGEGNEAGSAAHLYQRRKISWLAKAPGERSQSKGLDAGYQLERNAVVRLKKQGKITPSQIGLFLPAGSMRLRETLSAIMHYRKILLVHPANHLSVDNSRILLRSLRSPYRTGQRRRSRRSSVLQKNSGPARSSIFTKKVDTITWSTMTVPAYSAGTRRAN